MYQNYNSSASYSPATINHIPPKAIFGVFVFGLISLLAILFFNGSKRLSIIAAVIFVIAIFFQTAITLRWGTWISPAPDKSLTFEQYLKAQQRNFGFLYPSGDVGAKSTIEHLRQLDQNPFLARISYEYDIVNSRQQAYDCLRKNPSSDHLCVENFEPDSLHTHRVTTDKLSHIALKYNSFNNLRFDANLENQGFFVLSFPYNSRWQAFIDNQIVPVYRCNGNENAIFVQPGKHEVEFRYWSWPALLGFMVSLLALFGTVLYESFAVVNPRIRWIVIISAALISLAIFGSWYHSLYSGNNIQTHYTWNANN